MMSNSLASLMQNFGHDFVLVCKLYLVSLLFFGFLSLAWCEVQNAVGKSLRFVAMNLMKQWNNQEKILRALIIQYFHGDFNALTIFSCFDLNALIDIEAKLETSTLQGEQNIEKRGREMDKKHESVKKFDNEI